MTDLHSIDSCNWSDPNDIRRWLLAFPEGRFPTFRPESINRVDAKHPLGSELAWAAAKGGIRTTDYENVRRRLRLALNLAGISPSKAAQAIAVDKGALSRFITGKRSTAISQETLVELANFANIPVSWLLDGLCTIHQFSNQHTIGRSMIVEGYSLGEWRSLTPLFGYRAAVTILEKLSNILVDLIKKGKIHRGASGFPEIGGQSTQKPVFWCRLLLAIHDGDLLDDDEKKMAAKLETGIWIEEIPGFPIVLPAFLQHLTESMQSKVDDETVSLLITRRQLRWLLNKVKQLDLQGRDLPEADEKMYRDLLPKFSRGITQSAYTPESPAGHPPGISGK